jgi:23S rRNA pseudouridine955/2504/2580 synthase
MNSTQQWQSVTWFDVDEHQDGQRIDNFLFTRLKGVPKSRIYRLIREGQVRVNKKRIKAETRLNIGDQIRVAPIRYEQKDETAAPVSDSVAQSLLSRVVYEDEGLLVINKPSGIAVHGGSGVAYGLIEALRAATGKKYLELIHRIDRDTSGLVMISKKRSTLKLLQDLLREHKIQKTYAAIVKGQVSLDQQMIDAPLLRYELSNGERRVRVTK